MVFQSAISRVAGPAYNWLPPDMAPMPVNPEFLARMQLHEGADATRLLRYQKYQQYYDGIHPDMLPSADKQRLQRYCGFSANVSGVVVDALAERLVVTGFGAKGATQQLRERLSEVWQRNRMDDDQATVHAEAGRLGDSYVLVDWDNDRRMPRLNYNPAEMCSVAYEDASCRSLSYAVKRWDSADLSMRRKNVYFPNRIERYYTTVTKQGQYSERDWRPYAGDDGTGKAQPAVIDWTDDRGKPLGIAIVPFRNHAAGSAYGRSELASVLPLQDAINKTLVDLLLVLDTQGWPQRWVRGNEPPGGFQVGPGRVWVSNHPDFAAGELGSADPAGLRETLLEFIRIAATISRTPLHMLQLDGKIPSGEALKTAESPLVQKALARQVSFGNSWEDVMTLALRLDNHFGDGSWPLDTLILQSEWQNPELRNDLSMYQAVSTAAPFLPQIEVWRLMGYSGEKLMQLQDEWDAEQQKKSDLGSSLLDQFRTGDSQDQGNTQVSNGATAAPIPGGQATTRNPDNNR